MSLDSFNARALYLELSELVTDARLQKISQVSEEDFLLHLRAPGRTHKLLISLHQQRSRFHLLSGPNPPAIVPSSFLMLCRKHIQGTRLRDVRLLEAERVLELRFHSEFSLVFDWAGSPSTLLLIQSEDRVCLGRFPPGPRFALRKPYPEPTENRLPAPWTLAPERAFLEFQDQGPDTHPKDALRAFSAGWSPLWLSRFCKELDHQPFEALWDSMFAPLRGAAPFRPGLEDGELTYRLAEGSDPLPSMHQAAVERWSESTRAPGIPDFRAELLRTLKKGRDKAQRKMEKRKKDRGGAQTAPRDQMYGDLLLAYASQLPRRQEEFRTTDWEGRPVVIPLDPRKTATENADRYYTKAKKKKRALEVLEEQIALAAEEVAFWEELQFAAERAENRTDLEEIRRSIPGPRRGQRRKTPEAPTSGPRRYQFGDFQLLVGRNPSQNEKLSLRQAAKDDYWFHIRQGAGSHVILRTAGREPGPEALLAGAWLAARYSRAEQSRTAEVVYTRARHLKKPKGGPLGKVIYRQETELVVDPTGPWPEGLEARDKKGSPP